MVGFYNIKQMSYARYGNIVKMVIIGNCNVGKSAILQRYCNDTYQDHRDATIGLDLRVKTIKLISLSPASNSFKENISNSLPITPIGCNPLEIGSGRIDNMPSRTPSNYVINENEQLDRCCDLDETSSRKVTAQIWDTSGHQRFKSTTSAYYRSSKVIIFVYAQDNINSFLSLEKWVQAVRDQRYGERAAIIVIVAAKCDLPNIIGEDDELQFISSLNEYWDIVKFIRVSAKTGEGVSELFSDTIGGCLAGLEIDQGVISLSPCTGEEREPTCPYCYC